MSDSLPPMPQIRMPDLSSLRVELPLSKTNPAAWTFQRLAKLIVSFEAKLSEQEEIGGRLVSAPGEGAFHIDNVRYWGPDIIMFEGQNAGGGRVQLIQHYTQLNVLLTALPRRNKEPRRIGFNFKDLIEKKE